MTKVNLVSRLRHVAVTFSAVQPASADACGTAFSLPAKSRSLREALPLGHVLSQQKGEVGGGREQEREGKLMGGGGREGEKQVERGGRERKTKGMSIYPSIYIFI